MKQLLLILLFNLCLSIVTFSQSETELSDLKERNQAAYDLKDEDIGEGIRQNWNVLNDAKPFNNDYLNSLIYSCRGVLYSYLNNIDSSSFYHLESLQLREKIGDPNEISKSLNNLGTLFYINEQYDVAISYFKKSIFLKLNGNDIEGLKKAYNNIGIAFQDKGDLDSAKIYFEQGIAIYIKDSETDLELRLNYGTLYNDQKEWSNAVKSLKTLYPTLEYWDMQAICLLNIGIGYEGLESFDSAKFYYDKTELILDDLDDLEQRKYLEKSRLILEMKKNKDSIGQAYFNNYNYLNDSLTDKILASKLAELNTQYQVEKKDAEIELKEEKNKLMKAENEQYTLTIIALLALLVIIAILIVFVTRYFRQKRKLAGLELERKKHEIEHLMQGYELDLFEAQNFGQQEERQRIARDLHDRLGGLLAAVNLQIESLAFTQKAETSVELKKIKAMVSDGISEVRNVSHNMQAEALKRHGLKGALKAISKSINDSKKLKVDLYLDDLGETNGSELEREVYKIIMELISNTLKHAKANLITLQINEINHELMVVYEDDGIGFSVDPTQSKGLGMGSINSRVKSLKGNWQIDSLPNKGTTIIINIPTL